METAQRPPQAVTLHIERLVIDGLPLTTQQGEQLREQLQLELARLLTERTHPASEWPGGAHARLFAPAVHTLQPARLGSELARSLYLALGSGPR